MKQYRSKKFVISIVILSFGFVFFGGNALYVGAPGGFTNPDRNIFPLVQKKDIAADDIDQHSLVSDTDAPKANVLFLVDTSNAMLFSAKGKMDNWQSILTKKNGNRELATAAVNEMIKECTFGVGVRPNGITGGGKNTYRTVDLSGRDVDPSNNTPGDPDNYYTGDPTKPYLLTFRNETWANSPTLPKNWSQADLIPNDSRLYKMKLVFTRILNDAETMSKLRFALATTHVSQASVDFNQSQVGHVYYKRTPTASELLTKRTWYRRGATGNPVNVYTSTGVLLSSNKRAWDAVLSTDMPAQIRDFNNVTLISGKTFDYPYGTFFGSSELEQYDYTFNEFTQWSINSGANSEPQTSNIWLTVKRAYLRVPFGEYTPDHLAKFKMLIDGVQDGRPTVGNESPFFHKNPELTTTGQANMATAIFFPPIAYVDGRQTLINNNLIYYSHRTKLVERIQNDTPNAPNDGARGTHVFRQSSGEAAGSVIDFFSPAVGIGDVTLLAKDKNGYTAKDAIVGNFPIRNRCDTNWLIVLTAGDDLGSSYKSHEAVKALYDYTDSEHGGKSVVRIKDPTKNPDAPGNLDRVKLFRPIRTIVIGFVDKEDKDPNIQALVKELNLMADYGDDGQANGSAKAYFGNSVPELLKAIRDALGSITLDLKEIAVASSAPLVAPNLSGEEATGFLPGYLVRSNDQWQGLLSHYTIMATPNAPDGASSLDVIEDWTLQDIFRDYSLGAPEKRRVLVWNWQKSSVAAEGALSRLSYPQLSTTPNELAALMGVENKDLDPVPQNGEVHPSNLLLRWVFGQDYNTNTQKSFPRASVLADMGRSGYSLMAPISENSSQMNGDEDYRDWVQKKVNTRPETIFFHTNDGLLHAVDSSKAPVGGEWARERWAFIPPHVLERQRLAALKFLTKRKAVTASNSNVDYKQTLSWISQGSKPSYTTDGAVYLYNLYGKTHDADAPKWRTILIGSMGRGGSGLYALDVTDPADITKIRFLWGVENNPYTYNTFIFPAQDDSQGHKGFVQRWYLNSNGTPGTQYGLSLPGSTSGYSDTYAPTANEGEYRNLGYNAPSPLVGRTLLHSATGDTPINVGVLAAGLQYDLDLKENGLFGAAIYLFDPLTGKLQRTLDGPNLAANPTSKVFLDGEATTVNFSQYPIKGTSNPTMGMMLTPPAAINERSSGKGIYQYLEGYVVADNRGQIFEGSFKDPNDDSQYASATSDWTLRRVATLRDPSEKGNDANYCIPFPLSIGRDARNDLWLLGGTSNVLARRLGENLFDVTNKEGMIKNKRQFIFGLKRFSPTEMSSMSPSGQRVINLRDPAQTQKLDQNISADSMPETKRAWTIPLAQSYIKAGTSYFEEYLSASTILVGKQLYAATFLPTASKSEIDQDDCAVSLQVSVNGLSRIYSLDARNGKGLWSNTAKKYHELDGIKISGLTMATVGGKTRLLLSVTILDDDFREEYSKKKNAAIEKPGYQDVSAIYHTPTLISIEVVDLPKIVIEDTSKFDYWRQVPAR